MLAGRPGSGLMIWPVIARVESSCRDTMAAPNGNPIQDTLVFDRVFENEQDQPRFACDSASKDPGAVSATHSRSRSSPSEYPGLEDKWSKLGQWDTRRRLRAASDGGERG